MDKIIHYTFNTYRKKQILTDWVIEELEVVFNTICKDKGFDLICYNILIEHAHLLIKKKPSDSNEYVMKMIKGISSRQFFKKYPSNRLEFRKLWGRSYRAEEIKDGEQLKNTIAYIKEQKIEGIDKRISANWKPRRSVSGFQF